MNEDNDKDKEKSSEKLFKLPPPPPPPPSLDPSNIARAPDETPSIPPAGTGPGEQPPSIQEHYIDNTQPVKTSPVEYNTDLQPITTPTAGNRDLEALEKEKIALQVRVSRLEQELAQRNDELREYNQAFLEIKERLSEVNNIISMKDTEIKQLTARAEEMQASLKNKENNLFRAKAKISVLEEAATKAKKEAIVFKKKFEEISKEKEELETKLTEELQELKSEKEDLEKRLATLEEESTKTIESLRKEKFEINERLKARIDEIDHLKAKLSDSEKLIKALEQETAQLRYTILLKEKEEKEKKKIKVHGTQLFFGKDRIIELFNKLLDDALHNVMIVVPTMDDLMRLDLLKLKPSVKVSAMAKIDMANQKHLDYYESLSDLANIEIRSFDWEDRFGINVDRGKAFIGVNSKGEIFGVLTDDEDAIDFFVKRIIVECWTLARRLR
ncbi:MAG: hypothetical protein ACTSWN_11950 [Promethearchaeota archaeon]